ncbi:MAG: DUF3781 domain-containing protein [Oscillospiraceae bacterium]|nr:DUF3781 domain-containing protein [Oscillospiraceae bacterium]
MTSGNDLLNNFDKLHTTTLGVERIRRNLGLETGDVPGWCGQRIGLAEEILLRGKNWYVHTDDSVITINAHSYTIITAHKRKANELME